MALGVPILKHFRVPVLAKYDQWHYAIHTHIFSFHFVCTIIMMSHGVNSMFWKKVYNQRRSLRCLTEETCYKLTLKF